MKTMNKKQKNVKRIIERAAKELAPQDVTYLIVAIDREGGKVIADTSEFNNEDLRLFLTPFLNDRESMIALGLHLGTHINNLKKS